MQSHPATTSEVGIKPTSAIEQMRLRLDPNWLVIGLWPFLLLLFNSSWIFTPLGTIDPWIYLGYMQDLPTYLRVFDGIYFGTRLSWIMPGYALYRIFPPLTANYVLHLAVYYIAIFALYDVLNTLFNRRAALFAALLMGSYGWFLLAVGWDYVDGAGIAYMLLTIAFLAHAATTRRRWYMFMFLAGASFVAFVDANVFLICFTPFLIAYYLFINYRNRKNGLFLSLMVFAAGAVMIAALFGLQNYLATGDPVFFRHTISIVRTLTSAPNRWRSDAPWFHQAGGLIFPIAMVVASIVFLGVTWFRRTGDKKRIETIFPLGYVLAFLMFYFLNLTPYAPVLQLNYYASYLLPAAFLAVGAMSAGSLARLQPRQFLYLISGVIGVLVVVFVAGLLPTTAAEIALFLVVAGLAALALRASPQGWRAVIVTFAILFVMSAGQIRLSVSPYVDRDAFLTAVRSNHLVRSVRPDLDTQFWYDAKAPDADLYRAISSMHLWSWRLIGDAFPEIAIPVSAGMHIALLSSELGDSDRALAALTQKGITANVVDQETVVEGEFAVIITFIDVSAVETPG